MLDEWFKANPHWETHEKAEYLSAKRTDSDWDRSGKVDFIEYKLNNFIKILEVRKEIDDILSKVPLNINATEP